MLLIVSTAERTKKKSSFKFHAYCVLKSKESKTEMKFKLKLKLRWKNLMSHHGNFFNATWRGKCGQRAS